MGLASGRSRASSKAAKTGRIPLAPLTSANLLRHTSECGTARNSSVHSGACSEGLALARYRALAAVSLAKTDPPQAKAALGQCLDSPGGDETGRQVGGGLLDMDGQLVLQAEAA